MRTRLLMLAAACAALGTVAQAAPPPAPPDRPVTLDAKALATYQREQAPYIAHARATFPAARARFLAGLGPGFEFYVSERIVDAKGRQETCFVLVDAIADGRIKGRLATVPELVSGVRQGDRRELGEEDIIDWTIVDGQGQEEGNIVGNLTDRWAPDREVCSAATEDAKGQISNDVVTGWQLSREDPSAPFRVPDSVKGTLSFVQCARPGVIPFLSDTRALRAGVPFLIRELDGTRISALELDEGRLQLRMLEGEMTKAETEAAQVYLNAAQALVNASTQ